MLHPCFSHIKDKFEKQIANIPQFKSTSIKKKAKAERPKFRLSKHQTFCKGAFNPCNYVFKKPDTFTVACTESHHRPFTVTMNSYTVAMGFWHLFFFLSFQYVTCYRKINLRS